MSANRIATTRAQDLQPLGTAGQTAAQSWSALSSYLARMFSQRHAALLAEPVMNPANGQTDWYAADMDGAVKLTALAPDAQAAARASWQTMRADILAAAERLRSSRDEGERIFADMLAISMTIPDDSHILVRGDDIVLVAWGHRLAGHAEASPEAVDLTGEAALRQRPMPILPPPVLHRKTSVLALVLASVAAFLLLLGAFYVAYADPFGWSQVELAQCSVAPGELALRDQLRGEAAREADLRAQLAALTDDAGRRRLQCAPVQPPAQPVPAPTPAPTPTPPSDAQRRAERAGGQQGKLQVILTWEDINDLDLHVGCPNGGGMIGMQPVPGGAFGQTRWERHGACGGELDVDANGDARATTKTPVENVFFTKPGPGTYSVIVDAFDMKRAGGGSSKYRVTIHQEGQPDKVVDGVAHDGERNRVVTTFEVSAP